MPQDNEKLGLLYDALKNDEVFSQVIPSDAVAFAKEYSSPDKMRTLYDAIKADEIFKDAVPNTFEETIQEFGLGKPLVEPTKSGGSGSATKRTPQNIELQSQFPTNLQADQTQELIESNIQGAELAGLDYESISKQMAGRPPINFLFDQVNKIQDPEEKFKTKRSFYKIAINNISDANTNIRGNVEQMKQGMLQMQEQYEQGLNQYNEYLQQGDKETANLLAQDLNQQQENIKLAATQYEDLVKEYNYNAEFLGILNAGRAASFNKAKDEGLIRTGKLPIGAAMFSNMIGGTTIQFSPEETMAASAWNAITPNLVRTLASGIEIADYFVRPGSLESTNLSKMAGDALLDFANDIEVETEKFVPKGTELNIFKELNPYSAGQFAGSLIGSVAGSIGSGGLAGTGKAAMVFNAAQGYGGMYGWGKEAGLSSAEASALAAPVGLVYGYLGDKGVESLASVVGRESFKKIVLKGIKELGKDKTPKALSEVFLKSLQEFGKNTVKGAAKESLQEGVEFSSEFGMKVLASETGLAKTEDDLTFEAFMSGLEDSMKGGALGGGLLGGLLGASPRRTLATVVSESVNDPIKEQEFMDNMNALLNGTQIDQQQYDEVMQMYNRAKEVNNTVPSNVTNEQARAEAIDLIQERNDLQAQVEVIDPAMAKPFNDRIASIDQRLGEISEGKSITQPEDIQQQKEGMTEIVQPETPVETVDLTPQETPSSAQDVTTEVDDSNELIRVSRGDGIDGIVTTRVKIDGVNEVDAPLLAKYKGYDIVLINKEVAVYNPKEETLFFVATDDSKLSGKRVFIDELNNLDGAKNYIDLVTQMLKENKKSRTINVAETIEQPQVETREEPVLGDVESKIQQASMIKDAAKRKKALDEIFNSEEYKQFVESTEEELNNNKTKVAEGNGSWRKAFNETSDAMRKKDILRAIADVSTNKTELNDVLDAAKGLPKGLQSEINNAVKQKLESILSKEQTPPALKDVESIAKKSDADIEKRMLELQDSGLKIGTPETKEFNALEKEMEKRERDSVFNVPLDKVGESVDALMQKEKDMPNGFGAFIEKRDARETKEVADKYLNAKELTDAELKKDFSDAVRGNPTTWYADGLKMREALKEATNRGIDTKDMLAAVTKVYEDAGYDTETAKSVVANMLKPIFEGSQRVNENQISAKSESLLSKEQTPPALKDVESTAKKDYEMSSSEYEAERQLSIPIFDKARQIANRILNWSGTDGLYEKYLKSIGVKDKDGVYEDTSIEDIEGYMKFLLKEKADFFTKEDYNTYLKYQDFMNRGILPDWQNHETKVSIALSEGKKVPSEVLNEYPELKSESLLSKEQEAPALKEKVFTITPDGEVVEAEVLSKGKNVTSLLINGNQNFRASTEIFDSAEKAQKALDDPETFELFENEGKWKVRTKTYKGRETGNWVFDLLDKKQKSEYEKIKDEADSYGTKEQAEANLRKLQDFEIKNKEAFVKAKEQIDNFKQAEKKENKDKADRQKIYDKTANKLSELSDLEFEKLINIIDKDVKSTLEKRFGDRIERKQLFKNRISEDYHKAKADGSNPELVKAVEELLTPKENEVKQEVQAQEQQEVETLTPTTNEEGTVQEEVDPFAALEQVANELEKAAQDEAKKKSFSSQMNNIVDRIDKLIDDIDNSNIALSSIPFARQIARTALKVFRDFFDAAGRTPEAFRKAMQAMRDALSRDADYKNLDRQQQAELIKDISNELLKDNPFNFQGDERVSKFASRVSKIYANVNDVYTSQSQEKVRQEVIALIDELGLDVVLEYAESAGVPSGVKTAILGESFGRAKAAFDANPTPENRKAFNEATERLKQWGTDAGQGVAYFNKIYELFPELQVEQFQDDLNKQTEDNLGNQGKKKVETIKTETKKIRNDVFSAITNFFNDGVTNIAAVTDSKVKKALDVLLSFGKKLSPEQKSALSTLLDNVRNSGLLEIAQTKEAVREQVLANLKDINGRLSNPLSNSDLNKVADSFVEAYEYVAQKLIEGAINTAFQDSKKSGQQDKNSRVARLILYGALDNPQTLNAFAQKFGIPSITPQQASQLRTLAQRVNQSKGGQKAAAQRQLTNYINSLKGNKGRFGALKQRVQKLGDDFQSFFINNILFGATAIFAFTSNWIRALGTTINLGIKGETDAIKFAISEGKKGSITLPNGQNLDLNLIPIKDAQMAAWSGIPRLSEYSLTGVSDQEMKIRQAETRTERRLRRTFLVASSRLYSAADASVVPYYKAMTRYSYVRKLVLQMYKDNKQPKPSKVDLDKQVRGLIGLDVTNFDAIALRAYENTINSTLVDDLINQGLWNRNNPFPEAKSRRKPNSAEGQIYNEFMTNLYELHESEFYDRFLELQNRQDYLGNEVFDTGKSVIYAKMLKDIDRLLAKNTNEIAFFGRPSGFWGQVYDMLIKVNSALPILKYSSYTPLFIGAACNSASYATKTYPILNMFSYGVYKATGRRLSEMTRKPEFETDFGLKLDQANMAQTIAWSTGATLAIAAWLMSRYDTPEEKKKAFEEGRITAYINDLTYAQSQSFVDRRGNKLMKGYLYVNGYPAMPVSRLSFFGVFEAAGFIANYSTLESNKNSDKLFKSDQEEFDFKAAVGAYLANGALLSLKLSQTTELAKTVEQITTSSPTDLGGNLSDKAMKDIETKFARFTANLIPYNQLQRQIADLFVNADGGANKKVAVDFYEKVAMQTAFAHWIVKSDLTDPFGRPIPETFDVRGLTLGFNMFEFDKNGNIYTFLDKAYAGDKYMGLHISKNYAYTSRHSKLLPVTVELGDDDKSYVDAEGIVKELRAKGVDAKIPEEAQGTLKDDPIEYYSYNMEMTDEEMNLFNKEAAKQIKILVDVPGNYKILSNPNLTDKAYKTFMDKAYKYGVSKQIALEHKEELGEAYLNTVKKQYKNLQNDPIVKELGLEIPSGWSID